MLPPALKARAQSAREWVAGTGQRLDWLVLFLVRLTVGIAFINTGWGKLHTLDDVTAYFASLGLPAPHFQATLVATTEFVGGLLLVFGLFARFAAVPLMITMVVAIITAKVDDLRAVQILFNFDEYRFLTMFAVVAAFGAGRLSLDGLAVWLLGLADPKKTFAGPPAVARMGIVVVASAALLGFTGWGALVDHDPCDQLGAGEFPELVNDSHNGGDAADTAWKTCHQILQWKKDGKDPKAELKKTQPPPEPDSGSPAPDAG